MKRGKVFKWLEQQQRDGKIANWGVSLYESIEDAEISVNAGATAIEARYSLLRRDIADHFVPRRWNFKFIARSPLDGGALSGNYGESASFAKQDQRATWPKEVFAAYQELANRLRHLVNDGAAISLADLAIRFSAFAPNVDIVIPGAKSLEQLEANVNAVRQGPLAEETIREIDRLRKEFLPRVTNEA